jgi:hypothetical protein
MWRKAAEYEVMSVQHTSSEGEPLMEDVQPAGLLREGSTNTHFKYDSSFTASEPIRRAEPHSGELTSSYFFLVLLKGATAAESRVALHQTAQIALHNSSLMLPLLKVVHIEGACMC